MKAKLIIPTLLIAASTLPTFSQSQKKCDNIREKAKKEIGENFEKKDTIDYETIKKMFCDDIVRQYKEKSLEIIITCVYNEINKAREKNGLPPLNRNPKLEKAAQKYAEYMAKNNRYQHTSKTGENFIMRIKKEGYKQSTGENIDKQGRSQTPANVVRKRMDEEGHRKNILNPEAIDTGIGFAQSKETGPIPEIDNFFVMDLGKAE